ncbi:hypothetical protein [Streptomyces sp. BH104]|uniref:hypothetical protein n=1 Tax=unclassified Streptomyces TaxID=2593676 RepID=UPI003BB74CAD
MPPRSRTRALAAAQLANSVGDGVYYVTSALYFARVVGPFALTALLVTWGVPGWLVLGAVFLGAGAALGPVARRAEATRGVPREAPPTAAAR